VALRLSLLYAGAGATRMARKAAARRKYEEPSKPFVGKKPNKRGEVPAVAKRGKLTLRQIKRAVDSALKGMTFPADVD
jgi:hypothetical protein